MWIILKPRVRIRLGQIQMGSSLLKLSTESYILYRWRRALQIYLIYKIAAVADCRFKPSVTKAYTVIHAE